MLPTGFLPLSWLPSGYLPIADDVPDPAQDDVGSWDSSGTTIDPPADLSGAVRSRLEADPALGVAFPGGIHADRPGGDVAGPYLVHRVLTSHPAHVTSSSAWHDTRIRFTSYADSAVAAARGRDLVEAAIVGRRLDHAGAGTTPAFVADRADNEVPRTILGRQTPGAYPFLAQVDVQFYEGRPRAD